jgi:lysophospholipase L1-like esterase
MRSIQWIYCIIFLSFPLLQAQTPIAVKDEWVRKSIAYDGCHVPVQKIFERAEQNKKLTIGVIGGSITAGANASDFGKTAYAPLIVEWFEQEFPDADISFVNAGIGATNSVFGVYRVDNDLLLYKPDFVVVEFSVNDIGEEKAKISYEGLIRKILKSDNNPAVLALGLMNEKGENRQKIHEEICRYYKIPFISYRDAVYPEIKNGNMAWRSISSDDVHPNDTGHRIIADLVIHYLETIRKEGSLPAPLTENSYENSYIYPFVPVDNVDWTLDKKKGWITGRKGKPLEFTVQASKISIMYNRTIDSKKAADVYVSVDGKRKKLNTFFENGWGDYMYPDVLLDTNSSASRKLIFEYDDKNGKEFILHNIQLVP